MKLKYKLGLAIVVVMMAICLMTYQSYALWIATEQGSKENIVNVGCFEVAFEEVSAPILMNNTYPMSDEKGLTGIPYAFKITNKCSISSKYYVTLNTTTLNEKEGFNLKDKIKFAIQKSVESKPTSGINLGEYSKDTKNINTDVSGLNVANLAESIILATDTLNQNDEVEYYVYLWYDEVSGNEVMGAKFEASINVLSAANYNQVKTAVEHITSLANSDSNLVYDETVDNNLRYIGANPNNYVSFNDELWRVIGIMNNVEDEAGNKTSRVKIIRNESIGSYSWDTSDSTINAGYGINEWSQADAMKLLNPGYEDELVGGSLYWNRGSGNCYNGQSNVTTSCDFRTSGLMNSSKEMIDNVIWRIGSNGLESECSNILTSKFYELERSLNTGKNCLEGEYCNDNVPRTTKWLGKVALMYPSDYGYSSSGGATTSRETCLNTILYDWSSSEVSDCKDNNWLYSPTLTRWSVLPGSFSNFSVGIFDIRTTGATNGNNVSYYANELIPSLYLKPSIKIINGEGTIDSPFELSL